MSSLASRLETSYHDNGTKYNFYLIKLSVFQTCAHFLVLFLPDGSIFEEISTDDLLLPTLDVFVLEEGLDKQIIPFRSTHPQVNLHCSKRSQNGRFYRGV